MNQSRPLDSNRDGRSGASPHRSRTCLKEPPHTEPGAVRRCVSPSVATHPRRRPDDRHSPQRSISLGQDPGRSNAFLMRPAQRHSGHSAGRRQQFRRGCSTHRSRDPHRALHTLWPPLHCGEEPAAPRFPPRPLGDASRPIVAADSPNADGVGTVMLPVFDQRKRGSAFSSSAWTTTLRRTCSMALRCRRRLPASARRSAAGQAPLAARSGFAKTVAVQRLSGMRFESRRSVRLRRRLPTSKAPCSRWRMRLRALSSDKATRQHPAAAAVGAARHRQDPCRQALAAAIGVPYRLLSMNLSPAFGRSEGSISRGAEPDQARSHRR